jgi:hypothetical protein
VAHYELISIRLQPGSSLTAAFSDDELSFAIDDIPVISRIFVSTAEGEFIVAQWKVLAAIFTVTQKTDGRNFARPTEACGARQSGGHRSDHSA